MQRDLPVGTVTFLVHRRRGLDDASASLGTEAYANALAEHRRVVRDACASHGGIEVDTQGDAFFIAFPTAPGALAAASAITAGLESGPIGVRIGLHTGAPLVTDEGYVGPDVHRAARIAAAGHSGQVLVSSSTASLVGHEGLRDLGDHRFKDLSAPERVYQLGDGEFPALKSLHRTNLPVPATPFVGRKRELEEIAGLLERQDLPLLTLTGPGGTGKTRLALQAAAEPRQAAVCGKPLVCLQKREAKRLAWSIREWKLTTRRRSCFAIARSKPDLAGEGAGVGDRRRRRG